MLIQQAPDGLRERIGAVSEARQIVIQILFACLALSRSTAAEGSPYSGDVANRTMELS
jgi:hypothetical protein